ncbi:MET18-like protein [Mya arenaria]|uniref:protein-histidine N-methyltransferase n=1 Tax=Mya arenaria TaxID=6604 RepID=A0ABY7DCD7_MYAAR|nr:MET18-like protein [Mya arenaria]
MQDIDGNYVKVEPVASEKDLGTEDRMITEKSDDDDTVEDFKEIHITSRNLDNAVRQTYQISETLHVDVLDRDVVEKQLCEKTGSVCGVKEAAGQHSDLIPNVYEGGLTVWECSLDLAKYLDSCPDSLAGKTVLELGCGAGIPGIVAIKHGASLLHFQDYNPEVMEHYTIPSVLLNNNGHSCKCRYFSGDWARFRSHMLSENMKC